jgi:hypothetical protein
MKRWGQQKPVHLDEKEFKTDLGHDNFIFVGSSCDMFAKDIHGKWIVEVLAHCEQFRNHYLFQTKNPTRLWEWDVLTTMPMPSFVCTTVETNRWYPSVMQNSPRPHDRIWGMSGFAIKQYLTIEPIMNFDLDEFIAMIKFIDPRQVNIGADSGHNNLPEPNRGKVLELIYELEKFTTVKQKSNLKRLLI